MLVSVDMKRLVEEGRLPGSGLVTTGSAALSPGLSIKSAGSSSAPQSSNADSLISSTLLGMAAAAAMLL
jgi:hypothetical protein